MKDKVENSGINFKDFQQDVDYRIENGSYDDILEFGCRYVELDQKVQELLLFFQECEKHLGKNGLLKKEITSCYGKWGALKGEDLEDVKDDCKIVFFDRLF